MPVRLPFIAIAIALALPWGVADSQQTGVIAGRVLRLADSTTTLPARDAAIAITGTQLRATTAADGRYVIARAPVGVHTMRVSLLGHASQARTIRVAAGDTAVADFTLVAEPRTLAPISTDASPDEAELFATQPSVSTISLGARAMAGVPKVGEPDVIRVTQLLPGVVSRNDFNTGLNVRGGEADQNLILLDGHPIYNPFHLGGVFSTFMDATVAGIDLLTAAFPARHGGRLSSVLDVRSRDESERGLRASTDLSVLGASARLGGGFGDGKGGWSAAARRTYADAFTRIFTDNIFPYHFRDFHGRATYDVRENLRLGLTLYAGRDVLDANLAEFDTDSAPSRATSGSWAFDWGNTVVGVSLTRTFANATLEQRVSTSGFSTTLDLGDGALSQTNSIRDLRISGSLTARRRAHEPAIGYEFATHRITYGSGSSATGTSEFDIIQRPTTAALWINDLWRPSERWMLEAGVRADHLTSRSWLGVSPRASLKYFATDRLALTFGAGHFTQWLHSLAGDGPLRYFDIWLASDEYMPVASAWHWVAGLQQRVRESGSLRVEAFVKRYDRVHEANWSEDPQVRGDEFLEATGISYGADLLARWQPRSGASGWIAYSYALSSRSRDGARWAPGHDRRHDLDVVGTWQLARYRVGARFGFASGTPYTPIVGEIARRVYDPSEDRWGTGDPRIFIESLAGARNGARFPANHRLDLDISRDYVIRGATFSPYVSVVNAYNAQNVFVYLYDYSTDTPTRRAISQFPTLPSIGARVVY